MEEGMWYNLEEKQEIIESVQEEIQTPVPEMPYEPEETRREVITEWTAEETIDPIWAHIRHKLSQVTTHTIHEGVHQYVASIEEGKKLSEETVETMKISLSSIWNFLTQPVWIPNRRSEPVQHSRGVLFMLDTVRFGGTFAGIFTMLFVGLNYQSFWAIAQSYVDPLAEATGIKVPDKIDHRLSDKLKRIPELATAGQSEGNLLDHLPTVGPPDNRLIVPSLDLNVPIVVPPNDALISEDWKKLEEQIQEELQRGVVHYPGTARPGQAGNFFVTGHSSYFPWAPGEYKSVFARLHELNVGDEYWVYYNGDKHRYVIQSKKEIKPADVSVLDQPVNKRISTLMTCTPVGTTLRRLIITAQEVDPVTAVALEVGKRGSEQQLPKMQMDMLPI
jgi:LPXTG-site transpeptidase (sortase) family protein